MLRSRVYPEGVERLHIGNDSIGGWSLAVAAMRRCKALERLASHVLLERWNAAHTQTHTQHYTGISQTLIVLGQQVEEQTIESWSYVQLSGTGPG